MSFTFHTASFKNIDDMVKACSMKTDKTRHTIAIGGTSTVKDVAFVIDWCIVKFKPMKYDKVSVAIPPGAVNELSKLSSIFPGAEPFIKYGAISLKTSPEQQARINKEFSVGDGCKVHVKFDAAWTIDGKMHVAFKLVSIEKIGALSLFIDE